MSRRNRNREETQTTATGDSPDNPRLGNAHASQSARSFQGDVARQAGEQIHAAQHMISDVTGRYPFGAMAAGFGLGFGLGMLAVTILRREERPHWSSRLSPVSMDDLSEGVKQLPTKVAEYLPRSMRWK